MARTPEEIFYASRGYSAAEIAEIEARAKVRAAERAEELKPMRRSPWGCRTAINPDSTMTYAEQGITRKP